MKKITLLALAFAFGISFQTEAQTTMTQNTDQVLVPGGVSCGGGDNAWYREYDFFVTPTPYTNVSVEGVEFGIEAIDFDEELTVNVYDWSGAAFPGGFDSTNPPAPIATQTVMATTGDVGTIITVDFDTPATVAADANLVVQIVQPTISGNGLFLGSTAEETKISWISSDNCGISGEPTSMDDVGFPDAHHVINLIVDEALAVGDQIEDIVSVYPNPTTSVLNVNVPSNVEIVSASLVDVLGKETGVALVNGQMNTANLTVGVYILKVETTAGTLTQKVVKQ